jgi:hypothetical protein
MLGALLFRKLHDDPECIVRHARCQARAKLSANGIVASRQYARGVFAHKGESYSYDVKAQFKETEGTGTKSQGLGIVGPHVHVRVCEGGG